MTNSKPQTVLVTGAAGFIGSALIRRLIKKTENTVINIDKLTYAGHLENLTPIENSVRYHYEKAVTSNNYEFERLGTG